MSEFTNGPWEVHPIQKRAVHQPEYECWIPQNEADARLIAAAPELYEALTELYQIQAVSLDEPWDDDRYFAAMEKAKAAIKKARGE